MPSVPKLLFNSLSGLFKGNTWQKLTNVTVTRGKTVWPSGERAQLQFGVRLDYDGEVQVGDHVFHKLELQLNGGDIPAGLKRVRAEYGGTHAVLTSFLVKKDGTVEDVKKAIDEGMAKFREEKK